MYVLSVFLVKNAFLLKKQYISSISCQLNIEILYFCKKNKNEKN